MEDVLAQLGLNQKEAQFYLYLLSEGAKTASQLSKELEENRTNTYMVLDRLAKDKLVEIDEVSPVRTYAAADPEKLKNLIATQQQQLRQTHNSLSSVLPQLASIYSLGQHKPGVVYLEGIQGYKRSLADMAKSKQPVSVMGSKVAPENQEAWKALEVYGQGRKDKNSHTRLLLSKKAQAEINMERFSTKGYEVRFWGESHEGEIAIYDNKVAMTVYQPALVVTVITNDVLAQTFRVIFDQLWEAARA